ncbi:ABC transporter ATP-binding protein [Psychromonas sp. CNPT3]|uniref:ABC transporter ATP-binding protein/permease n=1 Tax=Psychromonas sp. CNPT3 TaxID=314282 RepID=UPI00006E9E46|nr:ABC transporter ATP-binding protein/permease [Psychromonas sp. CNPT3]AGH82345.1 ABC transporter ATP-binding protein [Psychromonas sp. CNPT3]
MKLLSQYWQLVKPFWFSEKGLSSFFLLLIIIAMMAGSVWLSVQFNQWNGDFYNALQQLDGSQIYRLLSQFIQLIIAMILFSVYSFYLQKKLLIEWRTWMTGKLVQSWLSSSQHHYHLKLTQEEPDNPDQRIAEDVYLLIDLSLDLLLSFLRSTLTLISFVAILWALSGDFKFEMFSIQWSIPGYMVWMCLVYTSLGTIITHWIGKSLQQLNVYQQKNEANFRASLISCRENSEVIAAQKGEGVERQDLKNKFKAVSTNWYKLMLKERNLGFFTVGYGQVSSLAPIFFALPQFLSGAILLGGLMQLKMAFTQVSGALSWFIYSYQNIAKLSATVERLSVFTQKIESIQLPNDIVKPCHKVYLQAHIEIYHQDKKPLLKLPELLLHSGELMVIKGRSGLGKSSLLRTLSGYWAHYTGDIKRQDCIWIPQKLYLAPTSLKALLCYPQHTQNIDDPTCIEVLNKVGLSELQKELDKSMSWSTRLSVGEQQRLMFARLLINKPSLILLDETTSALDSDAAVNLLLMLRRSLPESAILMVSHQRELWTLADQFINLDASTKIKEGIKTDPSLLFNP